MTSATCHGDFLLAAFIGHNLTQRRHDKVAPVHKGMWYGQLGGIYLQIVIQQYVYVYGAVVIYAVRGLEHAPETFLNVLRSTQQLKRRHGGTHTHGDIEKHVWRTEAPRLGLNKGRAADNGADGIANHVYGIINGAPAVSDI